MSPRTTTAMVFNSRFPEVLNISPTDSRCYEFLNAVCRRLLKRGRFWGTTGRFAVSATSQLISLPPQLDTLEKVAVSRVVLPLHDSLYEFLENGWGTRDATLPNGSGVNEVLEQPQAPTMVDVAAPGGTLTLKCDLSSDVGKNVLVLGYDTSTPPNWIRTVQSGVIADGEVVALAQGAGTSTVNNFGRITGVQPPTNTDGSSALDGQWWIYQGTITGTLLSNYQYWEVSPTYKRYLIPFVNSTITTVEAIGKLAFIPVTKLTDYPVIGNIDALILGVRALKAEEESDWQTAHLLWNGGTDPKTGMKIIGAVQELEFELDHMLGAGREIGINMTGSGYGWGDNVYPIV